jgi:hypothetical protein
MREGASRLVRAFFYVGGWPALRPASAGGGMGLGCGRSREKLRKENFKLEERSLHCGRDDRRVTPRWREEWTQHGMKGLII